MNAINKKKKGFTLVETVVCVLVVTLVTSLLFVMTNTAKNSYQKLQKSSEGQVLCRILTKCIQDELRYSTNVKTYTDNQTTKTALYKFLSGNNADSNALYVKNSQSHSGALPFTYNSNSKLGFIGIDCVLTAYNGKLYVVPKYTSSISMSSSDKYALASDSSYVYDLKSNVSVLYNSSSDEFFAMIQIVDTDGTVLIEEEFVVDRLTR